MFVMLFVLPEHKLDREQLAHLQEMAAGFGAYLAKELDLVGAGDHETDEDDSPLAEVDASEKVVDDPTVIGYLEDCYRLQ